MQPYPDVAKDQRDPHEEQAQERVTAAEGGVVKVWDRRGTKPPLGLPHDDADVVFSPDNQWLVTGTGQQYRIWKAGTWERPQQVIDRERTGSLPSPAAFTHDGKILAISPAHGVVRLLETGTWNELATLPAPDPRIITCLRFSRDGNQLAAATESRVIQLWDLALIRQQLAAMKLDW